MTDAPLLLDVTRLVWRRWVGRYPTGIDRVCLAYLERFGHRAQAVLHYKGLRRILSQGASKALFQVLLHPPASFRRALVSVLAANAGGLSSRGRGRLYLNIGHTGLDQEGFGAWVRKTDVRPVYFVHDLIPITHPQFCRAGEAEKHRLRMRTVLKTASGVIGNSQATLDSLADFARTEGLPNPRGVAAWLGGTRLRSVEGDPSPPPTFVVLGTIEGRKNHRMLLDIWSRLAARLGESAPKLLLIGQRGWEAQDVFERLDSDERLRSCVQELNSCSDDELAAHLAGARALLFPSLVEGFGLPLVEALGVGAPVIASDVPVFREIGQGVPTFIAPHDEAAWERAIVDFTTEGSTERAAQLKRMEQFRLFTWNDHFQQVEAWLPTLSA